MRVDPEIEVWDAAWAVLRLLVRGCVILCLCSAGCQGSIHQEPQNRGRGQSPSVASSGTTRLPKWLDRVVAKEIVFPHPGERALYRRLPTVTEEGRRSYSFALLPQPGMDAGRHFQLVTITWAPAGEFSGNRSLSASRSGVAGPDGALAETSAQTFDHALEVRVSLGSLLPSGVDVPTYDVEAAVARLLRGYQARAVPRR